MVNFLFIGSNIPRDMAIQLVHFSRAWDVYLQCRLTIEIILSVCSWWAVFLLCRNTVRMFVVGCFSSVSLDYWDHIVSAYVMRCFSTASFDRLDNIVSMYIARCVSTVSFGHANHIVIRSFHLSVELPLFFVPQLYLMSQIFILRLNIFILCIHYLLSAKGF